jgi:hypothetical protein
MGFNLLFKRLKSLLKMALCYMMWIFLCQRMEIPCTGNTILDEQSPICEQHVRQNALVATIYRIIYGWQDLPIKGGVIL